MKNIIKSHTQPQPSTKVSIPAKSLLGALLMLFTIGVAVVIGATTSSILISKNELNFSEKGNNYSYFSSISYSGQFIAYDSIASNLDQDTTDTHSGWDIFLMNRDSDGDLEYDEENPPPPEPKNVDIILITPNSSGNSRYPMLPRKNGLSADQESRFVVFQSDSSKFDAYNWLPILFQEPPAAPYHGEQWDPGSFRDVYLADLYHFYTLGRIYIYPVSCSVNYLSGGFSNAHSGSPGPIPISLGNPVHAGAVVYLDSSENPFVVFESSATNLIEGGTSSYQHIFIRDISKNCGTTGSMSLISKSLDGQEANGNSTSPAVSSDGRFVAFVSYATNLVPGPDGSKAQVYLLDRDFDGGGTSRYYLISSSGGTPGSGDSFSPSIGETIEGKVRVAFSSDANNLVAGDLNGFRDIFLAEVTPGSPGHTLELVSYSVTGEPGNRISTAPVISGDGLVVSFTSYANNLVFNDNNFDCFDETGQINCPDVFSRVVDQSQEFIWRTSLTDAGEQSQANSGATQLDGYGKYASFVTFADLLTDGAMGPYQQIYVRDHGNPPGNPIISPTSWDFGPVDLETSRIRVFTITFSGELTIDAITVDDMDHFSKLNDTCSSNTFDANDTCTFSIVYAPSAVYGDELGDQHSATVKIDIPLTTTDLRDFLQVGIEGKVGKSYYNPLVMID